MENPNIRPSEIATSHPELRFSDVFPRSTLNFEHLIRGVDLRFTYDGRAALFQLFSNIRALGRPSVLLPAFHCPTVVEPAIQADFSARFYRVRKDLTIDVDDFLRCLDEDVAAALVINYFGFPANIEEVRAACRVNKTLLIEDCAHSFLNANPVHLAGGRADFAIYSFKKLVPSSVGGGIRCNVDEPSIVTSLVRPPTYNSIVTLKRMIDQAISQSDSGLLAGLQKGADAAYGLFKRRSTAKSTAPEKTINTVGGDYNFDERLVISRIPGFARHILNVARLDEVATSRQANYSFLRDRILPVSGVEVAIHGSAGSVCPWALPVRIDNRSTIDRELKARGVPLFTFGETLHPELFGDRAASDHAIESAEYLSSHLLCFSIHQSISMKHLEFVGDQVAKVMSKKSETNSALMKDK